MKTLEFNTKERKYVTAIIRSRDTNNEGKIDSATWQLYTGPDSDDIYVPKGESVDEAKKEKECIIIQEEKKVCALIEIDQKGVYILEFIVNIGLERIVEKAVIKVV